MSRGQKLMRFEKKYTPSDCNSDTKIWMVGGEGGDLWVCKWMLKYLNFGLSYNMIKTSYAMSLIPTPFYFFAEYLQFFNVLYNYWPQYSIYWTSTYFKELPLEFRLNSYKEGFFLLCIGEWDQSGVSQYVRKSLIGMRLIMLTVFTRTNSRYI